MIDGDKMGIVICRFIVILLSKLQVSKISHLELTYHDSQKYVIRK